MTFQLGLRLEVLERRVDILSERNELNNLRISKWRHHTMLNFLFWEMKIGE